MNNKNYLFAPFENEEDKMMTWNSCKSGIDQGIMIFLGRLESSYDVIISELRSKNAVAVADERIIKTLEKEIRVLKAEIKLLSCDDSCQDDLNNSIKLEADNEELKAENKELKSLLDFDYEELRIGKNTLVLTNDKLKAENEELKADEAESRDG